MQKILTLAILLTVGVFGTPSISAQINQTQNHFANSTENSFLTEQTNRWRRNQPNRANRNQQKRWNRNQQKRWNRNQQNRWNRNQQNRWNRNQQNRNRYNPRMQRGVRTVNRTQIIRRGGQTYRQTTQYRYLPNGRTQTRVINLVRVF